MVRICFLSSGVALARVQDVLLLSTPVKGVHLQKPGLTGVLPFAKHFVILDHFASFIHKGRGMIVPKSDIHLLPCVKPACSCPPISHAISNNNIQPIINTLRLSNIMTSRIFLLLLSNSRAHPHATSLPFQCTVRILHRNSTPLAFLDRSPTGNMIFYSIFVSCVPVRNS